MSATPKKRIVNPRLGTFFAIFAAAFVALVLLAMIGEQLAVPHSIGVRSLITKSTLLWMLVLVPLGFYAAIGVASATREPLDFFASGRRVPAVYNGLILAFSTFGGTGLLALTGTLFLVGFDALCLIIGGLSGLVVMGILLAPFIRKFGAYTLPSYLGRRFESPRLRLIAAGLLIIPLLLMLIAEIKTAAFTGAYLTGAPQSAIATLMTVAVAVTVWPGGMRGVTWSSVAASIAGFLALLIPVAIVALWWTNLPFPQLSYGPLMRSLARQEAAQGIPVILAEGLTFDLPGMGLSSITKRFASGFSSVGPTGFVAAMLSVMMGVSVAPWLLPRIATAPGIYHARKAIGWATLLFGVIMLTAAAVAVFLRVLLLDAIAGGVMPDFIQALVAGGYAAIDPKVGPLDGNQGGGILAGLSLMRDCVLLVLPAAAGLPSVFSGLAAAGVLAVALIGASAAAAGFGSMIAEDIVNGQLAEPPLDGPRLFVARLCIAGALVLGWAGAIFVAGDPFDMLQWSLELTGSTLFVVLVASIWWKRTNTWGALAGCCTGFGVTMIVIIIGELDWLPIDPSLAGLFGVPASLAATIAATLTTPYPGRHMLELVRDIRVPGGEILYDREMRLLRLKKRQRTTSGT